MIWCQCNPIELGRQALADKLWRHKVKKLQSDGPKVLQTARKIEPTKLSQRFLRDFSYIREEISTSVSQEISLAPVALCKIHKGS